MEHRRNMSRREALGSAAAVVGLPHVALGGPDHWRQFGSSTEQSSLRITGMEVFVVSATSLHFLMIWRYVVPVAS